MAHDDGELARRREILEAQVREAEEKRDRLLEQLAAGQIERIPLGELPTREVLHATIVKQIDSILQAFQPTAGMIRETQRDLIADREHATLVNDSATGEEATKQLHKISTILDGLTATVDQLHGLAERLRVSKTPDEAGNA